MIHHPKIIGFLIFLIVVVAVVVGIVYGLNNDGKKDEDNNKTKEGTLPDDPPPPLPPTVETIKSGSIIYTVNGNKEEFLDKLKRIDTSVKRMRIIFSSRITQMQDQLGTSLGLMYAKLAGRKDYEPVLGFEKIAGSLKTRLFVTVMTKNTWLSVNRVSYVNDFPGFGYNNNTDYMTSMDIEVRDDMTTFVNTNTFTNVYGSLSASDGHSIFETFKRIVDLDLGANQINQKLTIELNPENFITLENAEKVYKESQNRNNVAVIVGVVAFLILISIAIYLLNKSGMINEDLKKLRIKHKS